MICYNNNIKGTIPYCVDFVVDGLYEVFDDVACTWSMNGKFQVIIFIK